MKRFLSAAILVGSLLGLGSSTLAQTWPIVVGPAHYVDDNGNVTITATAAPGSKVVVTFSPPTSPVGVTWYAIQETGNTGDPASYVAYYFNGSPQQAPVTLNVPDENGSYDYSYVVSVRATDLEGTTITGWITMTVNVVQPS